MEATISIGMLRQNPTEMIRAVKGGATYTLTDRGQAIAEITPYRDGPWRRGDDAARILAGMGSDRAWADQIHDLRRDALLEDPWNRP